MESRHYNEELVKNGQKESKKARVVCARCNNGWMSSLETSASSIVTRLVVEESSVLDISDQATLAHSAAKTALMEQTNASTVTSPLANYEYVFPQGTQAPGTAISLFQRTARTPWDAHFLHSAKGYHLTGDRHDVADVRFKSGGKYPSGR